MPKKSGARTYIRKSTTKRVRKTKSGYTYPIRRYKSMLNVHHFKYCVLIQKFLEVEMNGSTVFFSRNFKLNEIVNYAELVAMFDAYRINKVGFILIPRQGSTMNYQTSAGVNDGGTIVPNTDFGGTNLLGTSNYGFPEVCTVLDYNDSTTPTTVNELLEYSTFKRTKANRDHKRYLVPRVNIDISATGMSVSKKWLGTAKPDVEHYGIKGSISNIPDMTIVGTSNKPVIHFDLEIVYYVSLRNTR